MTIKYKNNLHGVIKLTPVFSFFLAVILVLLLPFVALADTADPSSIDITDKVVFRNLLEDGDSLYIFGYDVAYTNTTGMDSIEKTFLFRLVNNDGVTEYGTSLAYPYQDGGYNEGIVSFYFPAAEIPTWGEDMIIRVEGNPAAFDEPPSEDFHVYASEYTTLTDAEAIKDAMGALLIKWAEELQTAWGGSVAAGTNLVESTDNGILLSDYGAAYMRNAIPGLESMSPDIFLFQVEDPDYVWETWDLSLADFYADRWDGSDVGTGIQNFADLFNMNFFLAAAIPLLIAMVALMVVGAMQGSVISGLMNSVALALGGVWNGWIPMGLVLLLSLLLVAYMFYHLFFKNA